MDLVGRGGYVLVDLRETGERQRHGEIPGCVHAPYPALQENISHGGILHELASAKKVIFYCAVGERSAMAVQAAQDAGLTSTRHIHGGLVAWKEAGGAVNR